MRPSQGACLILKIIKPGHSGASGPKTRHHVISVSDTFCWLFKLWYIRAFGFFAGELPNFSLTLPSPRQLCMVQLGAVYKYSLPETLHGWLSTTTQNKEKEKEKGMESSIPAFSRVSKRQNKQTNKTNKIFRACESCRKRKVKCSGFQPCSNCEVYKCACECEAKKSQAKLPFYNDNNIIQKIDMLHACVEGLKEAASEGSSGLDELLKLDANLKAFRSKLAITVNSEIVGEYEDASAIEGQLLNIDSISFTKYDTYYLNRHSQQSVSNRFELYSPILSLSVKGVS